MLNEKLNALLANYEIMLHKLQTYHWYVTGPAFFQAHEKLEEYYDQVFAGIDEIAEKLLMVGGSPLANVGEFKSHATIEEAEGKPIGVTEAFTSVLADTRTLLAQAEDLKSTADDEGSSLICAFADGLIEELSKSVWMLGQMLA